MVLTKDFSAKLCIELMQTSKAAHNNNQSVSTPLDRYPSLKKLIAEKLQQESNEDLERILRPIKYSEEPKVGIASTKGMEKIRNCTEKQQIDRTISDCTDSNQAHQVRDHSKANVFDTNVIERQNISGFLDDLRRSREERQNRLLLKRSSAFTA